eukprot:scaffold170904_cov43-Prasinocladus_malaysianus.AAC.1
MVAVVEMLRRGQWALLRVENEFLSNASHYRGVSDVPVLISFAEMTLGKRKVQAVKPGGVTPGNRAKEAVLVAVSLTMAVCAAIVVYRFGSMDT